MEHKELLLGNIDLIFPHSTFVGTRRFFEGTGVEKQRIAGFMLQFFVKYGYSLDANIIVDDQKGVTIMLHCNFAMVVLSFELRVNLDTVPDSCIVR